MEYVVQPFVFCNVGVLLAAENVVNILKDMSKQVTTPEEIAQNNNKEGSFGWSIGGKGLNKYVYNIQSYCCSVYI